MLGIKEKQIDEEESAKLFVFLLLWMLSGDEGDEEIHCKLINFLGCFFICSVYVSEGERV